MRLEYYTPLKKALFCSLKVQTLKKFAAAHSAAKLLSIFKQRLTRHSMASTLQICFLRLWSAQKAVTLHRAKVGGGKHQGLATQVIHLRLNQPFVKFL